MKSESVMNYIYRDSQRVCLTEKLYARPVERIGDEVEHRFHRLILGGSGVVLPRPATSYLVQKY
jgi:hypothetical protein